MLKVDRTELEARFKDFKEEATKPQKNIQEMLEARPEYVVTTSEFNDVKNRLAAMHNRRKIDDKDDNRPRLKKTPGGGTKPVEGDTKDKKGADEEDERPTLKRRT